MTTQQISSEKRFASILFDLLLMTIPVGICAIPYAIYLLSDPFNQHTSHSPTFEYLLYLPIFAMSLYLCKDCLNGQSFAKRKFGLQVVDNSTNNIASPFKCFIRNFFCIIFPVEVIMAVKNPSRRLGDIVAGTKLTTAVKKENTGHIRYAQVLLCVLFSFAVYFMLYKLMGVI